MSETTPWEKEELYDVIAALSATIRELTNEIVELQVFTYEMSSYLKHLPDEIGSVLGEVI